MEWFTVFGYLVSNIFCFLALDLFVKHFSVCIIEKNHYRIKTIFILVWIFISLPNMPSFTYFVFVPDFIYIILISQTTFRKKIVLFAQFEIYYLVIGLIASVVQTIISGESRLFLENNIYSVYFNIITGFLTYMILYLYVILKKLSEFPTGKVYGRYFLIISSSLSILLIVSGIFVGSNILDQQDVAQLFFSLLLVIAFLSLSIYRYYLFVCTLIC